MKTPHYASAYDYDTLDRLGKATYTSATGGASFPGATENYSYDPDGNRKISYLPIPESKSEFNFRNQIIRDADYEYQYDLNGNIIAKYARSTCGLARALNEIAFPCNDSVLKFSYFYDADNKMTEIHNFFGEETMNLYFRHDPLGRRIFKRENLTGGQLRNKRLVVCLRR